MAIYIEIDALLDTRLGTIKHLWPDVYSDLMLSGAWWDRRSHDLSLLDPRINMEQFNSTFKARPPESIQNARMTGMVMSLFSILDATSQANVFGPHQKELAITIDTKGYAFSEDVKGDMTLALQHYLPVNVQITYIDSGNLPFGYLDNCDAYDCMVIYDLDAWLHANKEDFVKKRSPDLVVITPMLVLGKVPTEEECTTVNGVLNPFASVENQMVGIIAIHYWPVDRFSVLKPS